MKEPYDLLVIVPTDIIGFTYFSFCDECVQRSGVGPLFSATTKSAFAYYGIAHFQALPFPHLSHQKDRASLLILGIFKGLIQDLIYLFLKELRHHQEAILFQETHRSIKYIFPT